MSERHWKAWVLWFSLLAAGSGCSEENSSGGAGGSGQAGAAGAGGSAGGAGVDHLFALYACETRLASFCPDGDIAHFDREAFRDIYVDPFGAGPAVGVYANSDTGSHHAFLVPQCEDASIPEVVDANSGVDPANWKCPDGTPTLRCTDGTRPVAHYMEAKDPNSTKWIIGISVGGRQCWGDDCVVAMATDTHRFTSALHGGGDFGDPGKPTIDRKFSSGLFQLSDFNDYHRVSIEQCSGGRGIGTGAGVAHHEGLEIPVHHHGSSIVRATLDHVFRMASAPPTQIVFASHSNGSRGAYTEVDGWKAWIDAHKLTGTDVDVRLFANSLVHSNADIEFCNVDPSCKNLLDSFDHATDSWDALSGTVSAPGSKDLGVVCGTGIASCLGDGSKPYAEVAADGVSFDTKDYRSGGDEGNAAAEWKVVPDASCMSAHPKEPSACLDAIHVMLYHLSTPTFFAWSGYDRTMRTGNTTATSSAYEVFSPPEYRGRVVAAAAAMRQSKPGQKDAVGLPGHGVWVDSTADHEGPTDTDKLNRTLELDGAPGQIDLKGALRDWLLATGSHAPLCISDGKATANPSGFMNTDYGGTPASTADCF
ncbi:MAG: hypothetical protein R3B13_30600 [Polyangiaceae bacterium]